MTVNMQYKILKMCELSQKNQDQLIYSIRGDRLMQSASYSNINSFWFSVVFSS